MTRKARRPKRARLVRFDLLYVKRPLLRWVLKHGPRELECYATRAVALRYAPQRVRFAAPYGASLRIHRRDGRMAKDGERTFPRGADPRRSRG